MPYRRWRQKCRKRTSSNKEQVDAALIKFLVRKGEGVRDIERAYGVQLHVGPTKDGALHVVVNGPNEMSVSDAVESMERMLQEGVESSALGYSHFVSLPLAVHAGLTQRLTALQDSVFGPAGDECRSPPSANLPQGMCRSIFVKPSTFHLTVQMLKLWNEERVQLASEVLQRTMPSLHELLEGRPISVRLGRLVQMRGPSAKAHVVYAQVTEVDGSGRLLQACEMLRKAYREAGLVTAKDANERLKLHATVINTSQRKRSMGNRSTRRIPVDARSLLAEHGDADWGEYPITEAHLSQRFVYDSCGYYHCCSKICFPTD